MAEFFENPVTPNLPPPETEPEDYHAIAVKFLEEFIGSGWWTDMLAYIPSTILYSTLVVFKLAAQFLNVIMSGYGRLMHQAQGEENDVFYLMVASLLSDLLGVEVDPTDILQKANDRGRIAAMDRIGGGLLNVLTDEFTNPEEVGGQGSGIFEQGDGPPNPFGQQLPKAAGAAAARRFLGFVMSFAVREGNAALLSELASLTFIKNYKEYAEAMARNLGLGRMVRRALQPMFQILVADPLTKDLNWKYRPKDLSESQIVHAYLRGTMDAGVMQQLLGRLGYSEKAIAELVASQRYVFPLETIARMWRWQELDADGTQKRLMQHAVTAEDQGLLKVDWDHQQQDPWVNEFAHTVISLAGEKWLDVDAYKKLLNELPLLDSEKAWALKIAGLVREQKWQRLTKTEIETAYLDGVIDLDRYRAWLDEEHFRDDDKKTLEYLLLLKQKEEVDKAKAAKDAAKAKADAAAAKAQDEARKKAALGAGSTGEALTFTDWEYAYVHGHITEDDFKQFLTDYGFAGKPLELELAMEKDKRDAFVTAQEKAAALGKSAAGKVLDLAQVEEAYKVGILSEADLLTRLQGYGYSNEDAQVLLADERLKKSAYDAAAAKAAESASRAAKSKLTESQVVDAYAGGLIAADVLVQWLKDAGFSDDEIKIVQELADARKQKAADAAAAAQAKRDAAPKPKASLAEMRNAYVQHVISEQELLDYLKASGYTSEDIDVIVTDANDKREAADRAAALDASLGRTPASKPATFAQAKALYLKDVITNKQFFGFLLDLGYSTEDAQLLLSLTTAEKTGTSPTRGAPAAAAAAIAGSSPAADAVLTDFLAGGISVSQAADRWRSAGLGGRDLDTLVSALYVLQARTPRPQA